MEENLEKQCEYLRGEIRDIGTAVLILKVHKDFSEEEMFVGQHNEMQANLILSFRHLEDARMRLGKVMQQIQGGVSIFDREKISNQI